MLYISQKCDLPLQNVYIWYAPSLNVEISTFILD